MAQGQIGLGLGRAPAGTAEALVRAAFSAGVGPVLIEARPPEGRAGLEELAAFRAREAVYPAVWVGPGPPDALRAQAAAAARAWGRPLPALVLAGVDDRSPLREQLGALREAQAEGLAVEIGLGPLPEAQLAEGLADGRVGVVVYPVTWPRLPSEAIGRLIKDSGATWLAPGALGGGGKAGPLNARRVGEVARRLGVRPLQVLLGWMVELGMVPVVATGQVHHAAELGPPARLDPEARAALDERAPWAASWREPPWPLGEGRRPPLMVDRRQAGAARALVGAWLEATGRLPGPDELPSRPELAPPRWLARWPAGRKLEGGTRPGLLLDLDGTLRETRGGAPFPRSAAEVHLLPRRRQVLEAFVEAGYQLVGVSNQAGVALGQVDLAGVEAALAETRRQLGLPISLHYCPHPAQRPVCWCRKPLPGLGVAQVGASGLDPARTWMVGDRPPDEGFAAALGIRYADEGDFFGPDGPRP